MKKFLKLVPAFAMLLVAAILVSTSTYAWFSMNNRVTVTGMTVKTVVSDNLLISDDTLASTAKKGDDTFVNSLTQNVSAILEPASTIDGTNYWYTATDNVKANGDAITDTYVKYGTEAALTGTDASNYDDAFSLNYGVSKTKANATISGKTGAVPYVDYVFQLKAVNVSSSGSDIRLTGLDLKYNSDPDVDKAFRVAVFVEDITSSNPAGEVGTLKKIYSESGAANFTSGKAVNSASTLDNVSTANAVIADNITAIGTSYYKVVVRLWLEGEDTTCNNTTFAALTEQWALDLEIKLVPHSSTTAGEVDVGNINHTTTPAVGP